jgi:hypothetical protein
MFAASSGRGRNAAKGLVVAMDAAGKITKEVQNARANFGKFDGPQVAD